MNVHQRTAGPVRIVTIDRPEVRNAVDRPTAEALLAAVEEADTDPDVAVIVLTGAGGSFCAGADLHAVADPERGNRLERSDLGPMGPTRRQPDKPVIAAIEGHAVAGGLELALWCDLRVVAEEALAVGLATQVVAPGEALRAAIDLAEQLAALPQRTLRADLAATRAAFDRPLPEALLHEHDGGAAAIEAGGMADVARFQAGAGRHGADAGA